MAWNPGTYNKFKNERFAPFQDLVNLVKIKPGINVIDLGCGTGELTTKLAGYLPGANVLGIDSSKEMLAEAASFANERVRFEYSTIEEKMVAGKKWDLIFSHAAIQWIDDHETLLPRLISTVHAGGQLAIQIPSNHNHFTHTLLRHIALSEPYKTALDGWTRVSPVLDIQQYAQIFFDCGSVDMIVYEKAYPHVLQDANALYDWVSGTAMLPYIEKLPADLKQLFIDEYKKQLNGRYTCSPVFYPFKRIIMAATF